MAGRRRRVRVTPSQILDQGVARDDDPGGAVLFQASHGSQPGFQPAVVVVEGVVGVLDGVVQRRGQYLVEDAGIGARRLVGHYLSRLAAVRLDRLGEELLRRRGVTAA